MMTQNPKTAILLAAATLCVSLTGCGTASGTNEANNIASQLAQQTTDTMMPLFAGVMNEIPQ